MDDGGSPNKRMMQWKRMVSRLSGGQIFKDLEDVTEEEIISIVNEGHEQGVLLASEAEMIQNIFEFGEKDASDIMVHRNSIIAVDGNSTFLEVLNFVIANNYSRYPVYVDDIDNIIGILHIKEMLKFCQESNLYDRPIKEVEGLIYDAKYIPETRSINSLFSMMQSEKNHMVIVVDEYGQTAGIVAMEDIVEEIVGNIEDEHDEETPMIETLENGGFIMDGMTPIEDVLEAIGVDKDDVEEDDEFETLNGLLISLINHIPSEDEHISAEVFGYTFEVLEVENRMIKKVKVNCQNDEKMVE